MNTQQPSNPSPRLDTGWSKLSKANKIVAVVVFAIAAIVFVNYFRTETPQPQPKAERDISSIETAKKELRELMQLSIDVKLVRSYEFSDKANVVYADRAWYSQDVQFKKDFLAKVSSLKEIITGYNHFEIRDTYTDEVVAEVTTFSGSLKVYK